MPTNCFEKGCQPIAADAKPGRFLASKDGAISGVEIIHELGPRRPIRHVIFDFDGTLSLVRHGWMDIMTSMMVEILIDAGANESPKALATLVRDFLIELAGKPTIHQMIRLAEEVKRRGGKSLEPTAYERMYHDRLMQQVSARHEALRSGATPAEAMMVPHVRQLLEALRERGLQFCLASGTEEPDVKEEVGLLGLDVFFGRQVFGARDDCPNFSKAMVIERLLKENNASGESLLGFGDGFAEIQNVKSVGGVAVAVASDEVTRSGKPDAWKRERLIGAGADIVIPDYKDYATLLEYLPM